MSELTEQIVLMASSQNKSGNQIAKELGCSQSYVCEILTRRGFDKNLNRIDWESCNDIIVNMLDSGCDLTQIANVLEINLNTLTSYVKRYDLNVKKTNTTSKIEIKPIKTEFGTMYDYTDVFLDRPCTAKIPTWKLELQKRWDESNGKCGVYYGIGHQKY